MKAGVSITPNHRVWVPTFASIADTRKISHYIQTSQGLDVVSKYLDTQYLIEEMAYDNFYGPHSDTMELFLDHQDLIVNECQLTYSDLQQSILEYERFIDRYFKNTLQRRFYEEYSKTGYIVKKWLSPTQCIFASVSGEERQRSQDQTPGVGYNH